MPQSLARVVLHVVFSTKNRVPFLKDPQLRARLHAHMAGVLQNIGCEPILINGAEDHVHILCNLSRTITIAGLVEETKKSPSKWMKEQGQLTGTSTGRVDMARFHGGGQCHHADGTKVGAAWSGNGFGLVGRVHNGEYGGTRALLSESYFVPPQLGLVHWF